MIAPGAASGEGERPAGKGDDIIGVLAEELTVLSRTMGVKVRTESVQRVATAVD